MSQAAVALAAQPRAVRVEAPAGRQDARPDGDALPFARPQATTLGGWLAGIVFGLVCIPVGALVVVGCVVVGLALAAVSLVRRDPSALSRR